MGFVWSGTGDILYIRLLVAVATWYVSLSLVLNPLDTNY